MNPLAALHRLLGAAFAGLLLLIATNSPALAWGEYGHRTTAEIALANTTPATRAQINALMRAETSLGTPACPVNTLADAAVWPDCLRGESWRWAYTFSWHYQTQPVCKAFDIRGNCAGGNCITAQIERSRRVLADRRLPAAQRLEALAFLAHFVGDLHMPLHSGDNEDLGGNRVEAQYGIAPGRNLHAIWDGPLAERAISSAAPPLIRRYDPAERGAIATGGIEDWARESWQAARDLAYARAFDRDPCAEGEADPAMITYADDDIEASIPLLQQRITQAGLRLAKLLDETLGAGR